MFTIQDVKELRDKTGFGIKECQEALEYCEIHDEVTPIGYLRAKTLTLNVEEIDFYEIVKKFSK